LTQATFLLKDEFQFRGVKVKQYAHMFGAGYHTIENLDSVALMHITRFQFYCALVLMVVVLLMAPLASCRNGYSLWVYVVAAGFTAQNAYTGYRVLAGMRTNPSWGKAFHRLSESLNPFTNIWMSVFFWGPADRADNFTDVTSMIQQLYCNEHVQALWVGMWKASSAFSFLAPIAAHIQLWMVQVF